MRKRQQSKRRIQVRQDISGNKEWFNHSSYQIVRESILEIGKVGFPIATLLGAVLFLFYLNSIEAAAIPDNPLLYVMISVTFAFYYLMLLHLGVCGGITVGDALTFKKLTRVNFKERAGIYVLGIAHIILAVIGLSRIVFKQPFGSMTWWILLLFFSMTFIFPTIITLFFSLYVNIKNATSKVPLTYLVIMTMVINALFGIYPMLHPLPRKVFLDITMEKLNIRTKKVSVRLSSKSTSLFNVKGIKPDTLFSDGEGLFNDAIIELQGVGNKTVVNIKGISMAVNNDNIIVTTGSLVTDSAKTDTQQTDSTIVSELNTSSIITTN